MSKKILKKIIPATFDKVEKITEKLRSSWKRHLIIISTGV